MKKCGACAEAKAKQKSLKPTMSYAEVVAAGKEKVSTINERVHIDISSVKQPKAIDVIITKPHWIMIIDEKTEMKWSNFYKSKNGMIEPTCKV